MEQNKSKVILTWQEVDQYIHQLALKLQLDEYSPDLIVAIFRGGSIPAAMLQRVLARKVEGLSNYHMAVVWATSYAEAGKQGGLKYEISDMAKKAVASSQRVLLVDDIYDTGVTLNHVGNELRTHLYGGELRTAVLTTKQRSGPNYFGQMFDTDAWLVFPWED